MRDFRSTRIRIDALLLGAVLITAVSSLAAVQETPLASSRTNLHVAARSPVFVRLSPGLAEVLRMYRSRLEPEVIIAYIKTSKVLFNPTADELVTLKGLGVPQEVITTILEHDGDLRKAHASMNLLSNSPPLPAYGNQFPFYPNSLPPMPNVAPTYAFHRPFGLVFGGQVVSFNNSYPTFVNGQPIYSGYYVPGYIW